MRETVASSAAVCRTLPVPHGMKALMPAALFVLTAALLLPAAFGAENIVRRDITGGTPASVYEYPFVTLLVGTTNPVRACTGVLVSSEWVLTAAHCVDGLRMGEHSWDSEMIVSHGYPVVAETRHGTRAAIHENYNPLVSYQDWEHDIALVRMDTAYLSRTAVAVDLVTPEDVMFLRPGTMTTAVGWGGEAAESMTAAEWPLTSCPDGATVHLCTPGSATASLVNGDSGGPLLVRREERWVLIGIHSSVDDDSVHRHVRIADHLEWISGILDSDPLEDPGPCADDGVQTPTEPPTAPPPFQPQAVEVALGEASGNITLMTTEAGGFTLNGRPFESGGSVVAENGNTYLLTLAGGNWNAAYQAIEVTVTLGITEEIVALTRAEDGTYWLGDAAVQSGATMVMATNGNVYILTITTDGGGMIAWMAIYREPGVYVALGLSGDVVRIRKSEDGAYWLGSTPVISGETTVTAANGSIYRLRLTTDMSGGLVWAAELVDP